MKQYITALNVLIALHLRKKKHLFQRCISQRQLKCARREVGSLLEPLSRKLKMSHRKGKNIFKK